MKFWSTVAIGDGCWEWTGGLADFEGLRYGRFCRDGGVFLAHREAWAQERGPIPAGMCVLHRCDNPKCVRPSHLFLGTRTDNSRDKVAKGRQARGERLSRSLPRGEKHPGARLTNAQVVEMRALYASGGHTHEALARRFGCSKGNVGWIVRGDTRRSVS